MTTSSRARRPVALVTGGSRGLGAAIARRLARDGHDVAVNHRSSQERAQDVVDAIRAETPVAARAFQADVTDVDEVSRLVVEVRDQLGPPTVLVLNATGPQPPTPVEELSWDQHLDQLAFFVKSPTLLVDACLDDMRRAGGGRIVQVGSDVLDRALPDMVAYTAAKGAQLAMTRTLARALGPDGITVNIVAPGWVPVERHADADDAELERYREQVPLGRLGTPDDVAAAVSFLAGPDAAFVTGQRLTVNGGHTI